MLLELEDNLDSMQACFLDPQDRNASRGRGYSNLVLLRLQEARSQGPEVEEGFTMILVTTSRQAPAASVSTPVTTTG